jgi:pyruvate,water dikinase
LAQAAASCGKDSKAFKETFERFMEEYGDRPALSAAPTLGSPVWRERPEFVHGLIDALLTDKTLPDSEESFKNQETDFEAAKKQIEKSLNQSEYAQFQNVLTRARNATIVREESSFLVEKLTACMRGMILKFGRILAEKRLIDEANDVFFIFLEELGSVAPGQLDVRTKILKRKNSYAKVYAAHEKGIHWMNSTGSFPVFETKKKKKDNPDVIQGASASCGLVEGIVCVVNSPSEFGKLKKGDILVSAYTSPAWTPLFRVASAVVTERGSAISHAAIVSREYGIPCVVAAPNITNIVRDGQKIRVDGTNGTITILKGGYAHA